ncbi:hypothetical protein [Luteibacter aegosomatissinici]|uniref:hypothetical protein n=1 Tax=Luteibacter aegosomatissinici TaxID=2911539 RepID=UPI001FFB7512|nr:hypothetical protein [Luteibacter aegosomatissinici]UPG96484.1 hypothetical protein L2Y97_10325 [Luteibacter aegosomatissinici]
MKHAFLASTLVAGLALCVSASATAPVPAPLLGRWAVDTSRLPMAPEARPKSVTIGFADAGKNALTVDVTIVDAAGGVIHSKNDTPLDGTAAAVTGSPEADSAALEHPQPNVLVMGLSKGGVPASTRVYTAAPDGKTMTEIVSYFDNQGRPAMRTHYFTRTP